ncbi:dsRBD fold-containing protein [Nocardioides jensenii]|uniref:dsRBD fold-containing protein n=1 Tax=Nocardioides jensenii TaxID=1843 RepID=UPI0008311409|nr:dsRBD fold-containing protein [Nocardioides jensenii]
MSNQHTQTPAAREWSVRIFLSEHDGGTHAEARLDTGGTSLTGTGSARLSPADTDVPEIGDELAAGRALSSLAAVLLRTADADIEAVTGDSDWPPRDTAWA